MKQSKINKKIAKMLGFKVYGITVNGKENAEFGWEYPIDFIEQRCSVPETTVPDFIGIIKQIKVDKNIYMSTNLVRDYNTTPTIRDLTKQMLKEK